MPMRVQRLRVEACLRCGGGVAPEHRVLCSGCQKPLHFGCGARKIVEDVRVEFEFKKKRKRTLYYCENCDPDKPTDPLKADGLADWLRGAPSTSGEVDKP